MKTLAKLALATVMVAAAIPALAQETIGTMTVNGSVSTSTGGDFMPAASGEAIQAGERIMVGEGSSASVTFNNGAVANYTSPGVYTVRLPSTAAVGTAADAATLTGGEIGLLVASGIIAAAGIAASVLDDDEDLLGEPVSR